MIGRSLPIKTPFEWCCKCTVFQVSENPIDILLNDNDGSELTMTVQYGCKYEKFCKAVEDARTRYSAGVLFDDVHEYMHQTIHSCREEEENKQ